VRVLLDTHVLIWWDAGSLPARPTRIIRRADEVFVSAASAWEATIKVSLGKLKAAAPMSAVARAYGFRELPISFAHAERVATLPKLHRDPFDRLLIAQALTDGLTIVTRDPEFAAYSVAIAWD
jgi:PIN domain nuclease of toxin-antitoxin system